MQSGWCANILGKESSELTDIMIIYSTEDEEVMMNTNVTIVFMQKVEIILILFICIFTMLCVLVIFGVIM